VTGLAGGAGLPLDVVDLAVRLLIDLLAIGVLAYGLYYRRHGRRDLFTVYSAFNVGVFLVVTAITVGEIAVAVGFGLFAVLAMIRLRSEPFSHPEFAYFFLALVLALVCGVDLGSLPLTGALCAIALATAVVVDHRRILRPARTLEVTLEEVFADEAPLRTHLEERLAARVMEVSVLEIDYVREITRVRVACQGRDTPPGFTPPADVHRNGSIDIRVR
jgi:hypothetical protein